MQINSKKEEDTLEITLEGRLDTNTSPELNDFLKTALENIHKVILDLQDINYVSSAGLRVILSLKKNFPDDGALILRHVNEVVMDVLEMTGCADLLTIEQ